MATHSSILAYRITWTAEPGGLQSMRLHRVRLYCIQMGKYKSTKNINCVKQNLVSIGIATTKVKSRTLPTNTQMPTMCPDHISSLPELATRFVVIQLLSQICSPHETPRTTAHRLLRLLHYLPVTVVQSLSRVLLFATPWTAECQASLSLTISRSLLKLMSIELVMPSNHLILCRPLLFLPSIFPSVRVFSNELALRVRWPKYWRIKYHLKFLKGLNTTLEKEMATPSSILAWKIPWVEEPGRLQSMGLQRVGHD